VLLIAAGVLYARMRRRQQPVARLAGETVPLPLPASVRLVRIAPTEPAVTVQPTTSASDAAAESVGAP
jgi:hypothetical protein